MDLNPRAVVVTGYDRIGQAYLRLVESGGPRVRDKYLAIMREHVPAGARIIELGCGAGTPMTQALVPRYAMVALDISAAQLALARMQAPGAQLARADMVRLPFTAASADAVAAFYSMTHVPRSEHRHLLAEVHRVLRPGGLVILTTGANDNPDGIEDDWLGAPMSFSHFDGETNTRLVREAGFDIVSSDDEWEDEYGVPVRFRWIVATRRK